MNSGAAKLTATAEPSGIRLKAMKMQVIEPNCDSPRWRCARNRAVRNTAMPRRGRIATATATKANSER